MSSVSINLFSSLAFDAGCTRTYANFTNSNFPDENVAAASNYCRSPNGAGPWCMVNESNGDLACDACNISICPG